jgi:dephospho-CoA kinase
VVTRCSSSACGGSLLKVGLTGGLACGKSTVSRMFKKLGAHVIEADKIGHDLMLPGRPVYIKVTEAFGGDILATDGSIDRKKLAEAAFGAGRIAELNKIVHPPVIAEQERWMAEVASGDPKAVIMVEAALILEAGVKGRFEKLVVVTCRPELKMERYIQRWPSSGKSSDKDEARREFERRSAAQMADELKAAAADYVIDNSGTLAETEIQVQQVHDELKALASK